MIEFLLDRTTVITLAVIGGALSILASWCAGRGSLSELNIRWLTRASYAFMAASMILFIGAGLFAAGK